MVANRDQPLDRARALAREALAAWRGADPDQAIDACDHALALLLPVGPSDSLADVLRWKGSIMRDRGNHSAASDLYAQSLKGTNVGLLSNLLLKGAHFPGDRPQYLDGLAIVDEVVPGVLSNALSLLTRTVTISVSHFSGWIFASGNEASFE